jgi:hypothetical protein
VSSKKLESIEIVVTKSLERGGAVDEDFRFLNNPLSGEAILLCLRSDYCSIYRCQNCCLCYLRVGT